MKKWISRVLCAVIIVLGITCLLEGGFHIFTIGRKELYKQVPRGLFVEYPSVISNTEKQDVAVIVYRDAEKADTYYILEFSKNLVFDRFALTEVHQWEEPAEVFRTVVSSRLHHYAYSVDMEQGTVEISDGDPNYALPRFLITFALCMGISLLVQKKTRRA